MGREPETMEHWLNKKEAACTSSGDQTRKPKVSLITCSKAAGSIFSPITSLPVPALTKKPTGGSIRATVAKQQMVHWTWSGKERESSLLILSLLLSSLPPPLIHLIRRLPSHNTDCSPLLSDLPGSSPSLYRSHILRRGERGVS